MFLIDLPLSPVRLSLVCETKSWVEGVWNVGGHPPTHRSSLQQVVFTQKGLDASH